MQKSGRRPFSPDKHKTAWTEGRSLPFWPRRLMTSKGWRLELDNVEKRKAPLSPDKHKTAWT
ncbi:hypothetical protein GJU40_01365 [Bacillus lacus]|uniref:Uncharacterized protein n=1 Tax=Metabacillus lacus TaxID=1983721 RepID=A0A7X2IW62_9BACI|nr:hypothetical protein [Metabacillus lacus]MRX70814.1 hypothetical protein [Metabacillus lacus]